MTWAVRTTDLGRTYANGVWGLQGLSIELHYGSIVALLGANGAGKSTLIHLLCGALKPTTGTIEGNPDAPYDRVGWCSQDRSIDWYLTVQDNVRLGARLAGMSSRQSQEKTDTVLGLVGLQSHASEFADMLSGGQQQRIQIARAFVADPQVLFLDEPTAGLDVEASEQLMDGLRARAERGTCILVSSHDIGLLERRCDEILLLNQGRMVTFEPRDHFLQHFAGEDVVEIAYDGDLSPHLLHTLRTHEVRIVDERPLRLVISHGTSVVDLMHLVEQEVAIRDIRRSSPGLREAYLTFARMERQDDRA